MIGYKNISNKQNNVYQNNGWTSNSTVSLNESQLRNLIKNTITNVLKESYFQWDTE